MSNISIRILSGFEIKQYGNVIVTAISAGIISLILTPLKIRNDVAKVSIVGVGMRTHAGVAATMFKVLAREKIEIHLVATSEIKVACLVLRSQLNAAVCALHSEFIKEDTHAKSE